jgi:hypothetical protein
MAGDGLAEWLALHGMTAAQMLALIAPVPLPLLPDPEAVAAPDAEGCWALAAAALAAAFPDQSALTLRTRDTTTCELCADPARYPRAFTLWAPPYVSCPPETGARRLLTIAHEFGHACQIQASRGAMPPPILREMAAYLSELALLDQLSRTHPNLHAAAQAEFDAATRRILTGARQRLERTLQSGSAPYRYAWNYPPARAAALAVWRRDDRSRHWTVFDGTLRLSSLQS